MANNKKNSITEAMNELSEVKKKLQAESVSTEKVTVSKLHEMLADKLKGGAKVTKEAEEEEIDTVDSVETDDAGVEDITAEPAGDVENVTSDEMGGEETPADAPEGFDDPAEDMPMDDSPIDGDIETVDLTGASDEEVLSVFKKMNPEDEIEVKMDSEGNIEFNTGSEEFIIKTDAESGEEAPAIEPEIDAEVGMGVEPEAEVEPVAEPEGEIEMDVEMGSDEEGAEEAPESGDEVEDEIEDDLEALNEDSDKREMARVKEMGNKDKGHEQQSDKPKEVAPGSDADGEKPKEAIVANPKEVEPGSDAEGGEAQEIEAKVPKEVNPGEEKIGKLNESLKNTRKRLATTISDNVSLKEENERLKKELQEKTQSVETLTEKVDDFTKIMNQHTKVSKNLKSRLSEISVFATSLTNAVKILSEQTLTRDEKKSIVEKFDGAQTIEESERIYKDVISDLTNKSAKKDAEEVLASKINESVQATGSKQINESTTYSEMDNYRAKFNKLINR